MGKSGFEFKSDFTYCVWRISSSNQISDRRLLSLVKFLDLSSDLCSINGVLLMDLYSDLCYLIGKKTIWGARGYVSLLPTSMTMLKSMLRIMRLLKLKANRIFKNVFLQMNKVLPKKLGVIPKKVRSYTQKAETWKMNSTQRIVVTFNKFGKPVGDEGNELVQYLGTLVRMADHVSLDILSGERFPCKRKRIGIHLLSPNLLFIQMKQSTCAVKRSSRSKMKEPHITGIKSFARLAHELATKNNDVYPTRAEMYITTRTRKDGSIVDDKAAEVVASLKAIASDSTSTPGDLDDFTNDNYSKVKGRMFD
ncbi:hypothetical protein L1987_84997 [Smallanthus sonchifolius]|uniref:Uncharacterized protein n=1 Tax=Smallanthus sonchifolius TaxID=185202 RepID=A0ACB8XUQ7_9ASTR|nr:hypothetical protein L1987_84997 [Smallanthus sonchifolius]